MPAPLFLLPLLLAQAPVVVTGTATAHPEGDRVDVAYAQLAAGQTRAAIARIEGNRELSQDDPARLINLGTAYARLGDAARARSLYLAAVQSGDRYDLELATGQWLDSRRAARLALELLGTGSTLALK